MNTIHTNNIKSHHMHGVLPLFFLCCYSDQSRGKEEPCKAESSPSRRETTAEEGGTSQAVRQGGRGVQDNQVEERVLIGTFMHDSDWSIPRIVCTHLKYILSSNDDVIIKVWQVRSVNWCLGKDGAGVVGTSQPTMMQCMVPTATQCLTAALAAKSLAWIHQLLLEPHSKAAYI